MYESPDFLLLSRGARSLVVALMLASLGACATHPEKRAVEPQSPLQTPPVPDVAAKEPERYRPFSTDSLYALLVAEVAIRRGELDVALQNYVEQAKSTRDPGVVARAARMARFLNSDKDALDSALLWAEVEPTLPEARFNAASELIRAQRPQEAFAQMRATQELHGKTAFASVAAASLELPVEQQRQMLAELDALEPQATDATDVRVARAILQQGIGDNDAALATIGTVLEADPGNFQALLIEAQVYQNLGRNDEAFARVETALKKQPDNKRLRSQYARFLAQSDLPRAAKQFQILVDEDPDDAEMRLSLALVLRQSQQYGPMREQLQTLLDQGQQTQAAHYYLGEDAERQSQVDAAIEHYFAVEPSQFFMPAMEQAAHLILKRSGGQALDSAMSKARAAHPEQELPLLLLEAEIRTDSGDLDGALQLLSAALTTRPREPALLYARSMVYEKRHDLPDLEADLRKMLEIDPGSALALNALGYSLANLSDRHAEALELIERAWKLKPDDPAIIDSMGWVQYRLGNYTAALEHLRAAYKRYPDHEVAAHLGEVLWVMNQHKEALEVWKQGLSKTPDSPIIHATLDRLGASLKSGEQ